MSPGSFEEFSLFPHVIERNGNETDKQSDMLRKEQWWKSVIVGEPQGPHSNILMTGGPKEVHIYTQKTPNFKICLPKKISTFFSIPKKIPQCFCISKFYYLSSGKLKHANFNFGFGQKQNYKLRLCYCWFELMKNTIPKKSLCCFRDPKKSRRLS